MTILKIAGFLVFAVILVFGLFLLYSTVTWYNPPQKIILSENSRPDSLKHDEIYSLISWNIGYAGLGDDMDFFYDGGNRVRDSHERTVANLDSVSQFLRKKSSSSFIFLQEVDLYSKRSYYINQLDTFSNYIRSFHTLALNYQVNFVPVPLISPMGKVRSGIVTFSRFIPGLSVRYAYPGRLAWPVRLFRLRRCMLVNRYPVVGGKELVLINSHMSAFDNGNLKRQQLNYLKEFVQTEYAKGNYVVAGGDWNQSPPDFSLTTFGPDYHSDSFLLTNISKDFMPDGWKWVFDPTVPTNRYLQEPYRPGKTFTCLIDFFLVSPNVGVVQNKTLHLKFKNSDHNPVFMQFRLNP